MNHERAIKNRTSEIRKLLDKAEAEMLKGDWHWDTVDKLAVSFFRLDEYRAAQWRKARDEAFIARAGK